MIPTDRKIKAADSDINGRVKELNFALGDLSLYLEIKLTFFFKSELGPQQISQGKRSKSSRKVHLFGVFLQIVFIESSKGCRDVVGQLRLSPLSPRQSRKAPKARQSLTLYPLDVRMPSVHIPPVDQSCGIPDGNSETLVHV